MIHSARPTVSPVAINTISYWSTSVTSVFLSYVLPATTENITGSTHLVINLNCNI